MFILNEEQEYVVSEAVKWYYNSYEQVFQFDGGPGTGKSVVLNEIIRRIGLDPLIEVAAMAYIGSASLVMRMRGLINAKTIHSGIYQVQEVNARDEKGNVVIDTLLNVPIKIPKLIKVSNLRKYIKLIVVDEAFTVPLSMR